MSTSYSEGARALIYTITGAAVLTVCAITVLIISLIDPTPAKITFNVPEFIPAQTNSDVGCQFERVLQVIIVDDLADWLKTTNRNTVCLKKKSDDFWMVFDFEQP